MPQLIALKKISAIPITESSFQPYGQLITPAADDQAYDRTDAVLSLEKGIPRFYIMRLQNRGRTFSKITRHSKCTQCIGSLSGNWYLAVCPPAKESVPDFSLLKVFRISGNCFIKLELGTWHAGPYFDRQTADFYNLELSDTNVVDHFTYNFATKQKVEFEIVD